MLQAEKERRASDREREREREREKEREMIFANEESSGSSSEFSTDNR